MNINRKQVRSAQPACSAVQSHLTHEQPATRSSLFLAAVKCYTVTGPLVLVFLVRVLGLDDSRCLDLTTLMYVLSFVVLVVSATAERLPERRAVARSHFAFAGVALLWILILTLVLPSLAR